MLCPWPEWLPSRKPCSVGNTPWPVPCSQLPKLASQTNSRLVDSGAGHRPEFHRTQTPTCPGPLIFILKCAGAKVRGNPWESVLCSQLCGLQRSHPGHQARQQTPFPLLFKDPSLLSSIALVVWMQLPTGSLRLGRDCEWPVAGAVCHALSPVYCSYPVCLTCWRRQDPGPSPHQR